MNRQSRALTDQPIRVMIVDDNETLLASIAALLALEQDMQIVGMASGVVAKADLHTDLAPTIRRVAQSQ